MAGGGNILQVGMEDEARVISFLNVNFIGDEPLHHGEGNPRVFKSPFHKLNSGLCLKMESENGDLMGIVINVMKSLLPCNINSENEDEELNRPASHDSKLDSILRFLSYIEECTPVKDEGDVMHISILAVDTARRNGGIGRRLVEASIELARQKKIPGILVCCTNHYSSRILQKINGFNRVVSIPYTSYLNSSGEPVFYPPQPHVSVDVYHANL